MVASTSVEALGTKGWTIYGEAVRNRKCGSCKACCTAIPVELTEGHKAANVRCQHLTSRGCGIYARRPMPCVVWSCRWLMDETTADMRRPDHSGYIIDVMPDVILADGQGVDCVQIWVDPARRDAHRDPALRTWLAEVHRLHGYIAIVRWGSAAGVLLVPPAASETGEWLELGEQTTLVTHEQMSAKLEAAGVSRPWRA
jgi:hypothetical protein